MATERLIIEINEKGARVVKRNIQDVASSSRGAEGSVQLLRRALGLLGGALLIQRLGQIADSFTNLQNRLRIVTNSQRELNTVTEELLRISNRTRSSLETNAELFNRLALSTRELGLSQQDVLDLTESLNQAVILSGASATEAQAGLIQLSQGLASGALRGDELRSVLEQLPVVSDVIAKSLGITRGELRKMGEEGKITSEVIVNAFKQAQGELANNFGKTVPTLGQAFTVLTSNFTLFIGKLDTSLGVTRSLSQFILSLANNLDLLAKGAAIAGTALGVLLAQQGLRLAIAGVKGLTLALLANPLTAFVTILSLVTAGLVAFGDRLKLTSDGAATLQDFFVAAFERISAVASQALGILNSLLSRLLGQANETFDSINGNLGLFIRNSARALDRVVNNFLVGLTTIQTAWDFLPELLGEAAINAVNSIIDAFKRLPGLLVELFTNLIDSIVEITTNGVNRIKAFFSNVDFTSALELPENGIAIVENKFAGAGERFGKALFDKLKERTNFSFFSDQVDGLLERAEELGKARQTTAVEPSADLSTPGTRVDVQGRIRDREVEEILRKLRREGEILQLNNRERQIQNDLFKIEEQLRAKNIELGERRGDVEAQLRRNQATREQSELLQEIIGPQEEATRQIEALNNLFFSGALSIEQFTEKFRELRLKELENETDFGAGFERALLKFQDTAGTVADSVEDAFTTAFRGASDAIADFVETGKFDLNSLFSDLSRQLIRAGSQQLVGSLIGSASSGIGSILGKVAGSAASGGAGGGLGGLFSSIIGGLSGAQNGANFNVSSSTAVASLGAGSGVDNRLIAFRARDGENVTVTPNGQGQQRPLNINFTVNTPDADSFRRSEGQILSRTIAALNRSNTRDN